MVDVLEQLDLESRTWQSVVIRLDAFGIDVELPLEGVSFTGGVGRDDEGRALASGVYLCRLRAETQVETRKLLLVR